MSKSPSPPRHASSVDEGADPFIEVWKLNVEKSEFNPGPPPKSATVTQGERIKLTVEAIDAEGKPYSYRYTAYFDGKDLSYRPA